MIAACSSGPKPEETAPVPATPPPPTAMVTPSSASGAYRLRAEIQTGNKPPQRNARTPQASMTLSAEPAAVPAQGAPSGVQFNATVTLPGYSHAPRGRSGQAAAWWPIGGDSVVVQFSQGAGGDVQLRGSLRGTAMTGDIWYISSSSGSTFQLGTFSASKSAPGSSRPRS